MIAVGCPNALEDLALRDVPPNSDNVVALCEGRWLIANWTGARWLADGVEITGVERWYPCGRPWNWSIAQPAERAGRSERS
jgi:hypothetical protein